MDREAARKKALSIIVDTADDVSGLGSPAPPLPLPRKMDTPRSDTAGQDRQSTVPDSFFESFKCLEDDADDLDLRLQLDSFDEAPEEAKSKRSKYRNPSFRKPHSRSNINLNRSSLSPPASRPGTKGRSETPTSPPPTLPSPVSPVSPGHSRRKSRALSLRTGRPSIAETIIASPTTPASMDPDAAHYQDPEARLKLRLYLASPQKFDEAVEFGFPSAEVAPGKRNEYPLRKQQSCVALSDEQGQQEVTADDKSSVYSDELSVPESDSPKTPEPLEKPPTRPFRAASDAITPPHHNVYAASQASREMTLRMTLTRPDLRACDDQIYGWQRGGTPAGRSSALGPGEDARAKSPEVLYVREGSSKDSISMERQFAALEQWAEPERGVVKRFWDRVRRG